MKKLYTALMAIFLVAFSLNTHADDRKAVAEKLVKDAISHYKEVGQEKAFADFSVKDSKYNHGEFYIFVMSVETGSHVYHAVNAKLVGKNLLGLKDTAGKAFVKDLYENAKNKGSTWTSYQWPHPETKKIEPKVVYSEKHENLIFSTGYYE
jgi:cytochrome c